MMQKENNRTHERIENGAERGELRRTARYRKEGGQHKRKAEKAQQKRALKKRAVRG